MAARSTSIGPPRSRTLVKPRSNMRPASAVARSCSTLGSTLGSSRSAWLLALIGIDPSAAQLAFARQHLLLQGMDFVNDAFDFAVMPLVIFFVPEPGKGVAEMARVVGPGGTVAAYAWVMVGGDFPHQSMNETLGAVGRSAPMPPSVGSSRLDVLEDLWTTAGLSGIQTRAIEEARSSADFDDIWNTVLGGPSAGQALAAMNEEAVSRFRELLEVRLQPAGSGPITQSGQAHAIRSTVPDRCGAW